jgi:Ca-activated chloride channel family protein
MLDSPVVVSLFLIVALVGGTYLLLGVLAGRGGGGKGGSPAFGTGAWARRLPVLFLVGAVACLIAALAQFRLNREVNEAAVVLTMDTSDSMNQTDVQPNRLDAAVTAAGAFLEEVPPGFRVGLVTFAGAAEVQVTPTSEHAQVSDALRTLTTEKGTVIGDGIDAALDEIERDRETIGTEPAAIVLLSDGRDTGSDVQPGSAADRAETLGIPIFSVILGSIGADAGGANASLLEDVASRTDGQTFTAATTGELTQVYETLGSRLSVELAISNSAALFVAIAVVLALGAGVSVLVTSRPQY